MIYTVCDYDKNFCKNKDVGGYFLDEVIFPTFYNMNQQQQQSSSSSFTSGVDSFDGRNSNSSNFDDGGYFLDEVAPYIYPIITSATLIENNDGYSGGGESLPYPFMFLHNPLIDWRHHPMVYDFFNILYGYLNRQGFVNGVLIDRQKFVTKLQQHY